MSECPMMPLVTRERESWRVYASVRLACRAVAGRSPGNLLIARRPRQARQRPVQLSADDPASVRRLHRDCHRDARPAARQRQIRAAGDEHAWPQNGIPEVRPMIPARIARIRDRLKRLAGVRRCVAWNLETDLSSGVIENETADA